MLGDLFHSHRSCGRVERPRHQHTQLGKVRTVPRKWGDFPSTSHCIATVSSVVLTLRTLCDLCVLDDRLIGGAWALTAIVGSCELIYTHLKYYSVPAEQRQIVTPAFGNVPRRQTVTLCPGSQVRILFMVPIYAVDSWVALWEPTLTEYIDPIRDCYEAYVLYCFIALLQAYLGDEEELLARLKVTCTFDPGKLPEHNAANKLLTGSA